MKLFIVLEFLLLCSQTFAFDCDPTWKTFHSLDDLKLNGIKFDNEAESFVGKTETQKGQNPGRIQITPSIDFFFIYGSKVKKINSNFEYLRKNENFSYSWESFETKKSPVKVGENWMIGRTKVGDFYQLGKVRVGALGLYYEDEPNKIFLTDDYQILTCDSEPLMKHFEEVKEENSKLKDKLKELEGKFKETTKSETKNQQKIKEFEADLKNLTSIIHQLAADKGLLLKRVDELEAERNNLTQSLLTMEKDSKDTIKKLELEKEILERKIEDCQECFQDLDDKTTDHDNLKQENEILMEENKNLMNQLRNRPVFDANSSVTLKKSEEIAKCDDEEIANLQLVISKISEELNKTKSEKTEEIQLLTKEIETLNVKLSEFEEFIDGVENSPTVEKFSKVYEEIFSFEQELNCDVKELEHKKEICNVEYLDSKHFMTSLTGIFRKNLNQGEDLTSEESRIDESLTIIDESLTIIILVIKHQTCYFIPQNLGKLFPNLKTLSITNSNLLRIQRKNFEGLENLKVLKINSNPIQNIPKRVFENLSNLRELDLSSNQIKSIDAEAFRGLKKLEKISLQNNQIEEIPGNLFAHNKNLKKVSIACNKVQYFPEELFKDLQSLEEKNLDGNMENVLELCKKIPNRSEESEI